jgi:hypothetical protein
LIRELESDGSTASFLGKLVHSGLLRSERDQNRDKAAKLCRYSQSRKSPIAKRWNVKKSGETSTNNVLPEAAGKKRAVAETGGVARHAEANELMAGYGVRRGPRGGLIPRTRPDVDARRSKPPDAVGRATKNRKNNKKQKRDKGSKEIALRHT